MEANPFWGTPASTRKRRKSPEPGGKERDDHKRRYPDFSGLSDFNGCLRHIKFGLMVEVSKIEPLTIRSMCSILSYGYRTIFNRQPFDEESMKRPILSKVRTILAAHLDLLNDRSLSIGIARDSPRSQITLPVIAQ
jgi:hypothetical protein